MHWWCKGMCANYDLYPFATWVHVSPRLASLVKHGTCAVELLEGTRLNSQWMIGQYGLLSFNICFLQTNRRTSQLGAESLVGEHPDMIKWHQINHVLEVFSVPYEQIESWSSFGLSSTTHQGVMSSTQIGGFKYMSRLYEYKAYGRKLKNTYAACVLWH